MRVGRSVTVVGVVVAACACGASDDPAAGTTAGITAGITVGTTVPAASVYLADSQRVLPTVPPPDLPPPCDPAQLSIEASAGDEPSTLIVRFTNDSPDECEIDLGEPFARPHQIEPDVWLAPGATAELWGTGEPCPADATPVWELAVNGTPVTIALPADTCSPVPTAFF